MRALGSPSIRGGWDCGRSLRRTRESCDFEREIADVESAVNERGLALILEAHRTPFDVERIARGSVEHIRALDDDMRILCGKGLRLDETTILGVLANGASRR